MKRLIDAYCRVLDHLIVAMLAIMVRDDPIKRQMEHFGAVVRGEAQPIVSALDGLKNLRITEAIVEAAKTGAVVETG